MSDGFHFVTHELLEPIFDKRCNVIGWIEPGSHLFDTNMSWVGYIVDGHAWSVKTNRWAGPVRGLLCIDKDGGVVAWNPGAIVSGMTPSSPPTQPPRPPMPSRPSRPAMPPRPDLSSAPSWSPLTFREWIGSTPDRWR